jgi:hypothetical protein
MCSERGSSLGFTTIFIFNSKGEQYRYYKDVKIMHPQPYKDATRLIGFQIDSNRGSTLVMTVDPSRGPETFVKVGEVEGFIDPYADIAFSQDFDYFIEQISYESINAYRVKNGVSTPIVKDLNQTLKVSTNGNQMGIYYVD